MACKGRYTNTSNTADMYDMDVTVTSCQDGSYCCGNGTSAQLCCDMNEGVFMLNGDAIPYNQFKPAFSTSTLAYLQPSASPANTLTPPSLTTSPPGASSLSNNLASSIPSPSAITPSSLSTSPPPTSSSPGSSPQSASSAPSLSPSSRIIVTSVFGSCVVLLLIGTLVFILRKLCPKQPQKLQISWPRVLNLPPEMIGDDGTNELDGNREFELDSQRNYPEMPTSTNRLV